MNALLNRRWEELSGDQLRQAFFGLWRMNHTQTAALVRECLEGGPERGVADFETSQALLRVGIEIQDDWSRDYALSVALDRDFQARGQALMLLAWRWKGELSLTAGQVDRLIDQIMTSGPSDLANRERAMLLGVSRDCRAIPALLRLLDQSPTNLAGRDTRIAALRALGRLQAIEARQICLTVAESDSDAGTRITAVRTLLQLGFEDARVEAAAKTWIREMLLNAVKLDGRDEPPTMKRWIDQVKAGGR